ncbi:MAG: lysophospholipid acyltransferase family protein [Thermogemmatispora sp.]|uniref:lysophospholipid acyltransferase family protein n=1 Tax=Thermogemmatispora sp. TaxID=1968838 RepID=UPI00260F1ACF|nr:lysophospholipid acyltransferase family protein [Thermogemmatispora sp.]MBX5456340.1 lysophospholipid acyltransferase family protein [Thermogemmatispora sp.]
MSVIYWLARGTSALAGRTPRPLRHAIGATVGTASYLAWRSKRRVTQRNMAQVLGRPPSDRTVRRLARASWSNYGRYASDFLSFAHLDIEAIERQGRDLTRGASSWREYLQQALQPGRGVILTTAHFGNWDLAGAIIAREVPFSAIAETFADPQLNALVQKQRQDKGIVIIPMERSARPILRVLQQNQMLAIVIDRPLMENEGVPVRFFGRTTYVPAGAARLAVRTGAAIMSGFVWYGRRGQHYMRAFPPVFPRTEGDREAEVVRLTQYIFDTLEEMVRSYPDQWYMFRPFWPAADP